MSSAEIRELIIKSLDVNVDQEEVMKSLEEQGISFDFNPGFEKAVMQKLSAGGSKIPRETEFSRYMLIAFRNIALSGIAAIIILLISIYISEGTVSLDSFFGLGDSLDESIICLLTGK